MARLTDAANCYVATAQYDAVQLYKLIGGSWTQLDTASAPSTPFRLKLRVVGNNLKVYTDTTLVIEVTNGDITTGKKVGIRMYLSGLGDDWSGGDA